MPTEIALLESRALRADHLGRVDVLDKVKALQLLPDGLHVTTDGVAQYFAVHREAVHSVVRRHRDELTGSGMFTLTGDELRKHVVVVLTTPSGSGAGSYPQGLSRLRLFTRRTVLNIAMLLRDGEVARSVRSHLLDTAEQYRSPVPVPDHRFDGLDRRVTRLESAMAEVGPALRELGPVLGRMSDRLDAVSDRLESVSVRLGAVSDRLGVVSDRLGVVSDRVESLDRRLSATNRVVGAMSVRLSDLGEDMADVKHQLPYLAHRAEQARRRRRRHRR
ncbi:hypothetical protein [Streptomyces sp. NBC_01089]|uniref:hypothetical protein n=1 Tax=Streptomyces sp. NBC_01089 TaxID=2903747 RepID=UPI00386A4F57|nr:hypothetical protein OG510_18845 [Streptomyces sp. NBC_01089]